MVLLLPVSILYQCSNNVVRIVCVLYCRPLLVEQMIQYYDIVLIDRVMIQDEYTCSNIREEEIKSKIIM